jgi:hypothetical protein
VIFRITSTIVACFFSSRKTNWARVFLKVINKQIAGTQKTPTSVSCYLVHLYKHLDLLTHEELEEYEFHMQAVEEGDSDQKEADHSDEESEKEDVREVVGPITRKKNQEPAK